PRLVGDLAADRSPLHHGIARRAPLDDDRARGADTAGDGHLVHALALAHSQNGPAGFVDRSLHQRGHDLDLAFEILGQALRRDHSLLKGWRIPPDAPTAVLRFPYLAHYRHLLLFFLGSIIGSLPHCSNEICAMHLWEIRSAPCGSWGFSNQPASAVLGYRQHAALI